MIYFPFTVGYADRSEATMHAVSIHSGSGHVRGNARKYPYVVASLFETYVTKDGRYIWRNAGVSTHPRRSMKVALKDARVLASEHNAILVSEYGSLHNRPAPVLREIECDDECVMEEFPI